MRWEGHSRQKELPKQRVGGGKVHSVCGERHQPAWLGSEGPKEQVGWPSKWGWVPRRECTVQGIPGTVAITRMTLKEEWALLSPPPSMRCWAGGWAQRAAAWDQAARSSSWGLRIVESDYNDTPL